VHHKSEHAHNKLTKFVILAAPRTGSNLLCTLLHSHPDVLCHHEIFNPEGVFVAQPLRQTEFLLGSVAQRNSNPIQFLQKVWSHNLGYQWTGFKMTHKQQPDVFKAICEDASIHKIVLRRKAKIKTYVSKLIAEKTGVWEDYHTSSVKPPSSPVHVSLPDLLESTHYNDSFYQDLETAIKGHRTNVVYEEIFEPKTQQRLLDELGLSPFPLKAISRCQNPYSLKHLISNIDSLKTQIANHVQSTELIKELNEI
jgi:hypothetical protein